MRSLLIDDFRTFTVDRIARTGEEGVQALQEERWGLLYLDHDLGEGMTGYDVACWLEKNPQHFPERVIIVSSNPVGRRNIERVLEHFYVQDGPYWILTEK